MPATEYRTLVFHTARFSILNITPPFIDICLESTFISRREFSKIVEIAAGYPNDARLIEMVRIAGDASGKVPICWIPAKHRLPSWPHCRKRPDRR